MQNAQYIVEVVQSIDIVIKSSKFSVKIAQVEERN